MFEYKVLSVTWSGSLPTLEAALNAAGAEGWEVVDMRWQQGSHDFVAATMKREKPKRFFANPDIGKAGEVSCNGTEWMPVDP